MDGDLDAHKKLFRFKPSSMTMTLSKFGKTQHMNIIQSILFWSLTCLFRYLGAASIPANTALIFSMFVSKRNFKGGRWTKTATETSHEYQTVSVHPAGGDSLRFQLYLGGSSDSLNSFDSSRYFWGALPTRKTKHD